MIMFMALTVNTALLSCAALCAALASPAFAQISTSQLCQNLVAHTPDADVAYNPKSDVHGRYVAPADVPNGYNNQSYLPKTYNVLITVDQAEKLNLPSTLPYKAEAVAAMVQVQPNGLVSINGQPINADQQQVLCSGH